MRTLANFSGEIFYCLSKLNKNLLKKKLRSLYSVSIIGTPCTVLLHITFKHLRQHVHLKLCLRQQKQIMPTHSYKHRCYWLVSADLTLNFQKISFSRVFAVGVSDKSDFIISGHRTRNDSRKIAEDGLQVEQ